MIFKAKITIMPLKELLDPQGKTTLRGLHNLGYNSISDVRIGKNIEISIEAKDQEEAEIILKESCDKLLVNKIMEQYSFKFV